MPIVSSTYTTDAMGWTIEKHLDSDGREYQANYWWDGFADRNALMVGRAGLLNEQLAAQEAEQWLSS